MRFDPAIVSTRLGSVTPLVNIVLLHGIISFTSDEFVFGVITKVELALTQMMTLVITGLTVKVCFYEESDHVHTEDKTFYTEDDFRDFLSRRGWTCLREYNGYRNVDSMDELCPGVLYRGVH